MSTKLEQLVRDAAAVVSLLALTLACGAPQQARSARSARAPEARLVVASDLANPPFAWVADDGTARGRDVEMMDLIARALGRELEWRRMPFDELLRSVELGEVDAVCATLGITAERQRRVLFTRPYFETSIAVVVRAGDGEPTSVQELAGRRVSASRGTTSERAAARHLRHAELVLDNAKGLGTGERLRSGEIDAAVMDGPAADAMVDAAAGRLVRLAEDLGAERYAIALPIYATELAARMDRALAGLARFGLLKELDVRHGLRARTNSRGSRAQR